MKRMINDLLPVLVGLTAFVLGCAGEPESQEVPISKFESPRITVDHEAPSKSGRNIPMH